ncbi:protein unc-13 homolog [Humulus lupulus]|uniref:protein unc-13 homolog n=1 Tax=Humulus lupulus TaxID=3486 RepID=UPI002B418180|nr:protein unc-13 homolog [Humulus lupulus]
MAHMLKKDRVTGGSRKYQREPSKPETVMPIYTQTGLVSPFGELGLNLTDSELRETAYEILVGACRNTSGKPLTYIPQSEKTDRAPATLTASPSLQRSLTSTAASRVKKALGLKSSPSSKRRADGGESVSEGKTKRSVTVGEMIRIQMRVSEQTDSRIRRALLRVAAGQLGRRMETMVLPLELLQQFKASDFPNQQQEFEAWQRRNLKVLEAGLLLHPCVPLDKTDSAPKRLRMIIQASLEKPIETGKNSESMQALRSVVMSLSCRSFDGSVSDTCHWADGYPLNLKLYQMLLESCFDVNDDTSVIEEVDEVLELIKKTWEILGINQMLHNLCFLWILFHRFVTTGQVESDLLLASNNLLVEVEKDARTTVDSVYSKILSSTLSSIMGWAEKRLLSYRDIFDSDNIESMQNVVSLGVLSAKILVEDVSHNYHKKRKDTDVARDRVDSYIRSSLRNAFAQKLEKLKSSQRSSKGKKNNLPLLAILAQDISELAFSEKAVYSPVLKGWHPLAAGVSVATLHSCYGNELKQFVAGISELTPDALQVLRAADKLEKDLVQIAVEDAVNSDDGGKSVIREMPPYEAEAVIVTLVKDWIKTRVDRLKEWVDRNLQLEVWNPQANKEHFAPSAIEVLRIIDDTLEAFFLLPIPMHSVLIPDLMKALDRCLQHYVSKAKSGCGSRSSFIPTLPSMTRCSTGSKFHGVFKKKDKSHLTQRKSQVGTTNGDDLFGVPQLCVRISTLQLIRLELGVFKKRIVAHLGNAESDIADRLGKMFELSESACMEGVLQLCEATAYKVIFHELSHALWDGLYIGEVSSSRIEPFLQELEQYLEVISSTVHDRARTRVITDVMKASFDCFLLVLLAGGPSRAFTLQDSDIIEEDFKFLTDLFWSNGDGLPSEIIDKFSKVVKSILPLYHTDTESLIEQFKRATLENFGSSAKSKLPLPPTSGQWSPNEPNTLLRVLCYRNDEAAAKFLKKTYNLPKKL